MRFITDIEATNFRLAASGTFNDLCNITTYVVTTDDFGDEVLTPTTVSGVACGISFVGPFEGRTEEEASTQVDYDATVRLPLTTDITSNSQITIVDKQDTSIGTDFQVTGFPEIGVSAINVNVKEVSS